MKKMDLKTKSKIMMNAQKIAALVQDINTDFRGNLYWEINEELRRDSQHYTGQLFGEMAVKYGVSDE